jgi:hypothetical protein
VIAGILSKAPSFRGWSFLFKIMTSTAGSTMRRVSVGSTSIASIGYLPARRELEIEFRESGDVYRYFDVPEEEYAAFMAAESKGTYLNQVFKPREYRFFVVLEGRKSRI